MEEESESSDEFIVNVQIENEKGLIVRSLHEALPDIVDLSSIPEDMDIHDESKQKLHILGNIKHFVHNTVVIEGIGLPYQLWEPVYDKVQNPDKEDEKIISSQENPEDAPISSIPSEEPQSLSISSSIPDYFYHCIGFICDVFGPIDHPHYILRYLNPSDIEKLDFSVGETLYVRHSSDSTVDLKKLSKEKFTDASNAHDEEGEEGFSDDEEEKRQKWKRRSSSRGKERHGETKYRPQKRSSSIESK
ncbi:H/ACA ribonucleoprotein complex, subunit Gar1/Naf1 like protein [Aduncisulcus paluster]|uniref:H/ACA ribonucleoprotein complex, subunit Gar1/Naf1 like protein n=1 Tax=Aduncisulcus paluster TaxID=2918883 RepID=A0ABQ5KI48_9EUKA|nr:H/ACA ribonucleoprotein complex, subunit Gar1/Naf1 like protein [Aduncisulcus paluster]